MSGRFGKIKSAAPALVIAWVLLGLIFACDEEPAKPERPEKIPPPPPILSSVADYDYSSNQYFWFNHPSYNDSSLLPDAIFNIDVFRSLTRDEIHGDPSLTYFPGQAYVDSFGTGADIESAMARVREGSLKPPHVTRPFELLMEDIDYEFIYDFDYLLLVVGIRLKEPVPEHKALAVWYTNRAGHRIGGLFSRYGIPIYPGDRDTLALELIKPPNPRPTDEFGWTWDYMMRFFYNLGMTDMAPGSFRVTIEDVLIPRTDRTTPVGSDIPYLRIFGLDQYARNGKPGYDGEIDYREGALDLERGILIFPSLRPFAPDTNSIKAWSNAELRFRTPELYYDFIAQLDSASLLYTEYLPDPTLCHQYNILVREWR